jgi:preprotein translocase subunit SecG
MSLSFSFLHLIIVLCNFRKKGKNRKESSEQLQEQTGEDKLSKDDSDDEILGSILK